MTRLIMTMHDNTVTAFSFQSLFQIPVPTEWDAQTEIIATHPVCIESKECQRLVSLVHQTLPLANIISIDRIQNLWLWDKYTHCKAKMLMKSQEAATEQDLFHGTRAVPPEQLDQNEHGFDFRLASRRARWGAGSYFTPCASYSDRYAYRIPGTVNKQVLITKVLIGVSCLWPEDNTVTKPPPKPANAMSSLNFCNECYESIHGQTTNTDIYIIYDHEKAYPAYVVT